MASTLTITLEDLEIWTHIGVPEEERATHQKLLITLNFSIPTPQNDQIAETVDYALVAQTIQQFADKNTFLLIETFANQLANELQKRFPILSITLTLKKFILPNCRWVAVTLTR
ncbi:MAG: dihydroneopterin aldolase [Verrucomicrobiae bacterium]|nr:dihydroneopterin aldolase [Verrucomicrobiae bacterium]